MFWVIENDSQFEEFMNVHKDECFIELIPSDIHKHPSVNDVCAVFIKPLISTKGFILPISHNDAFPLSNTRIVNYIGTLNAIYTRDKKFFLHFYNHNNIIDISGFQLYSIPYTPTHNWYSSNFPKQENLNRVIPLSKHYEYCDKIYEDLKENIHKPFNKFYNDKISLAFNFLEENPINFKQEGEYFPEVKTDRVYSNYNFNTTSTRPSNTFKV